MMYRGKNLVPENLETGEYKVQGTAEITDLQPWYIVAYADDTFGFSYNGIYSGILYHAFSDKNALRGFIVQVDLAGKSDHILTIFTVPKLAFYPLSQIANSIEEDIKATPRPVTLVSTPAQLDGYTPKNNKLRTYPYMYVGCNPPSGNSNIYRYEDFENGTPQFKMISEINPNPQVAIIPQNYRGQSGDSLSDISYLSGYPTISWSVDVYNVWLAQNTDLVNLKMQNLQGNASFDQARNLGKIANSIPTSFDEISNGIKGAISGAADYKQYQMNYEYKIAEQVAQMELQQKLPNTGNFGGNNTTLLGYDLIDNNIFTRYTIKKEFAKIIDDYFSMYGYQTNELKVPNISNRPNWNYIKTLGINIIANIPQRDLQEICSFFDNGITLWHNVNTFLDYSQNNK